jgi:N-acetyltransferase
MNIEPVTLIGKYVRLEPLSEPHVPDLARVGLEPEIWRYMRYGKVENEAQLRTWVQELLNLQEHGTDLPFAVRHQGSGYAI